MSASRSEDNGVRVVPFERQHTSAFRDLNVAWIERHFTALEEKDRHQVEHPEETIAAGGQILIAEDASGVAIGCVALIPYSEGVFELAKMAVADEAQGRGVGRKLMDAAIAEARRMGARAIYLESNSKLTPALRLYEQAGFRHLPSERRPSSPYARCDVYMWLEVEDAG